MKNLLLIILMAVCIQNAFATEEGWYYIYIQTEYPQGPWSRVKMMDSLHSETYLEARQFEELFGSDGEDMANKLLNRLKQEDSIRYIFRAELLLNKDTVVIKTKYIIPDFEAVKNELVATFTFNSYAAVRIIQQNESVLYRQEDISVPYMDLAWPSAKTVKKARRKKI